MENFQDIQVIIDPEVAGMNFDVRRPYFRMRGKPVTEEQAFDIIRRTDEFFCLDMRSYGKYRMEGVLNNIRVWCNVALNNSWYSARRGWVHSSGIVGMNGLTAEKYPVEAEFLNSVLPLKQAFPYLDFIIAVTDWNEFPDCLWDLMNKSNEAEDDDLYKHTMMSLSACIPARTTPVSRNTLYTGCGFTTIRWN